MVLKFSARREEIPGDLPPLYWYKMVLDYEVREKDFPSLAFYSYEMEYLSPAGLARVRAKVRVWYEITGEYPTDLSMWGEIRKARKHGFLPHLNRERTATIVEDNGISVLRCGFCNSRYSNLDVSRCNACDTIVRLDDGIESGHQRGTGELFGIPG